MRGSARRIQAGEYALSYQSTPDAILDQLVQGDVIQHTLTIVEGWTVSDLLAAVHANPNLIHTATPQTLAALSAAIEHQDHASTLEGLFYPDTYAFPKGTTDMAFLTRAHQRMQQQLAIAWGSRAKGLPYKTAYQALILASLVEKETSLPDEKPIIAGIIVNRLQHNMLLQIDAAVLYGVNQATGQTKRKLTRADLRADTPYNTYRHRGIVPTPIALPSIDSIRAILHPAATNYFYYVAKGDGTHYFSKTLQEHREAVVTYQGNAKQVLGSNATGIR